MGGCISKCSRKKGVTEVVELFSPPATDSDVPTKSTEERDLSERASISGIRSSRRRFCLKNLRTFVGKSNEDQKSRWAVRSKPLVIVSPMHDDVHPKVKVVPPASKENLKTSVARDNSDKKIIEEGEKSLVADKAVKLDDGISQPIVPKQTVNANIRTLKLLRGKNAKEDDLDIIDFGSEDDSETSDDSDLFTGLESTLSSLSTMTSEDSIEEDTALLRPMTAHQKRLSGKHGREAAAFENINNRTQVKVAKKSYVDDNNVKVIQVEPDGPKIKIINVRPKSPERVKIKLIPRSKAPEKIPSILPLRKAKEQMVPRLSEMQPLDEDLCEGGFPLKSSLKFAHKTESESQSDADDVTNSALDPAGDATNPAREHLEDASATGGESSNKPVKAKKKRPVKSNRYTKGRFIPQPHNPEEFWYPAPKPVVKKSPRNTKNYEEFSTRLLPPSEKARATEGKILDGTLITWPRYIKRHEQFEKDGAQPAFLGRHGFKMAWGGDTTLQSSPAPVLDTDRQFLPNGTGQTITCPSANRNNQRRTSNGPLIKKSRLEPVATSNPKLFIYKPPPLLSSKPVNKMPFFKEKKFYFNPSTPQESSGEEEGFTFAPEDLRRYEKKRRAKLQRRPKTPFHAKNGTVSKMSKPRAEPRPSDKSKPEDQVTKLISLPAPNGSSERRDSKCVTFEIPLEGTTVRPPASRPNTRRQMRPNTPRADAEELALRQENAQKRREDAMSSRARSLGKRGQDPGTSQKDVRQVKAQELLDKVSKRMKRHGENRKKQIENIVTKKADNSDRIQKQKDHIFHRDRFLDAEPEASSVSNPTFTIDDMVEIDRFFDKMDEEKSAGDS